MLAEDVGGDIPPRWPPSMPPRRITHYWRVWERSVADERVDRMLAAILSADVEG